jgi:hypothetical protein
MNLAFLWRRYAGNGGESAMNPLLDALFTATLAATAAVASLLFRQFEYMLREHARSMPSWPPGIADSTTERKIAP